MGGPDVYRESEAQVDGDIVQPALGSRHPLRLRLQWLPPDKLDEGRQQIFFSGADE